MLSLKRITTASFAAFVLLGTIIISAPSTNAQTSELWRPNPLNSYMANRYHRRYAHRRAAHQRAAVRHAARRYRHR